jgi:mRNA interferase MazF
VAGGIARGDVRLCHFDPPDKRDSSIGHLSTVTPIASTIRGVPSEVLLGEEDGMKAPCAVNLHNAITVSQKRLGRRVAQLSVRRMSEICAAVRFAVGCDFH